MNIEQNDQVYEQPKKSGKGLFACGGVGCILLLLFCGGIVGLIAYMTMPVLQIIQEAQTLAAENNQVIEALGDNINFGAPVNEAQNNETGEITMSIPISGDNGSGSVKVKMKMSGITFVKTAHTVELEDGTVIDLMSDGGDFDMPEVEDGE